jgi:hypothetical protein
MKDHDGLSDLDLTLRQALAGPPDDAEPSPRVVAAVMDLVRRETADRPAKGARLFDLLVGLLTTGMVLAWVGVRLGLTLWPGAAGFLRAPVADAVGEVAWLILQKTGRIFLTLVSTGFGSLVPLVLLGFLAITPLALRFAGRSAS